jgi:hypothetical protein
VVKSSPEPSYNPNSEPSIQSSSSNDKSEDALIDPELTHALGKWQDTFVGTAWEGNPPIALLPKWLAYYGPDVLCYMIGKAKDKDNPGGWLYTTYDNWRKDGEVAPYVMKAIRGNSSPFPSPVKDGKIRTICEDGSIEEIEAMPNG